ncbi:MAG: hypothetical protein QXR48_01765 [Candidatus Woesearchaeota archaeon]
MSFKETIKEKVPPHLQDTPEFPIILKMISEAKISGPESLMHWLNVEIEKCKNDLKAFGKAGSTMNRKRVQCAKRMELLKLIQDKIMPYVK